MILPCLEDWCEPAYEEISAEKEHTETLHPRHPRHLGLEAQSLHRRHGPLEGRHEVRVEGTGGRALEGAWVELTVEAQAWTIREVTQEEAEAWWVGSFTSTLAGPGTPQKVA